MNAKGYSECEWEVKVSKTGEKILLLGGRAVYSLYDPLKQVNGIARKLIAKTKEERCDHIIIIGLGLGYLPRSIYSLGYGNIIVWEPFPVMQQSFPVCSGEWKKAVTVVYNYSDFKKSVLHFVKKGAKPKLFIHPGYDIFCRLEYRLAIQFLGRIYNNNDHIKHIVSQRSLEAMVRLPFLGSIKDFEGLFKGKRAVLTNPGPSLKQSIPVLKKTDTSIVFASLQSASFLQKNGIKVHFVVCADPKDMTSFLAECSDDFEAFFAETSVDPLTLDWRRKKTFLFHFRCGQIHEMIWEKARLPIMEDPVSSVSEVMLLLAGYMGFNEIYCIGMDFCWKDSRYSYRTQYKYDNDLKVNDMMSTFRVLTSDNQIATTQSVYFHAARYMQQKTIELRKTGKKVFQIAGGIDFNTTAILSQDELDKKLRNRNEKIVFNVKRTPSPVTIQQVDTLLKDIKRGKGGRQYNNSHIHRINSKVKLWSFLQEIPAAQRIDMCNRYIEELTQIMQTL